MGTFVAGSHELSPSINYLLHNKILSGQISANATQVPNGSAPIVTDAMRRSSNGSSSNSSGCEARSGDVESNTNNNNNNSSSGGNNSNNNNHHNHHHTHAHFRQVSAVPPLPPIRSSTSAKRLAALTIEEYERNFRDSATDLELVERIFHGGMESDQLRSALWPYLFGLVKQRGRFKLIKDSEGNPLDYVYIEHEENIRRWLELERLYYSYQSQWKSIMPDQELRFSTFRERKSLIERDVIRSDRAHPFYSDKSGNLSAFTTLLMTYMMYDFDIGYLQGMSDLAAPILYVFNGELVKSFWVFVEVMKLFRRNFEPSQKTIHFQLNCLFRLVKMTDSKFAQYLNENECSNCFFAFRCIVCQFKRELMKNNDENNYTKVLSLWDTIWSVQRRHELLAKSKYVHTFTIAKANSSHNHHHPQHKYHKSRHHYHNYHYPIPLQQFNRQHSMVSSAASSAASSPTSSSSPLQPTRLNGNNRNNGSHSTTNGNNNNNGYTTNQNCFQNGLSKVGKCKSVMNSLSSSYNGIGKANVHDKLQQSSPSPIVKSKGSSPAVCTNGNESNNSTINRISANGCVSSVSFFNGHSTPALNNNNSNHHNHNHNSNYYHHQPTRPGNNSTWEAQSPPSRSPLSTNSTNAYSNSASDENGTLLLNGNHHNNHNQLKKQEEAPVKQEQVVYTKETFYSSFDPNQADIPRFELTETEKFVLSLCLSLIRRERNHVLRERLDPSEIHQHFINPRLSSGLDNFIENAYHIYHFLNTDCDMKLLVKGVNELDPLSANGDVGPGVSPKEDTADTYDLLRDYLIISPSSCSTSRYKYSVSQKSWDHFLNNSSSLTD